MSGFYILACHTGHYQVNGLLIQATQSYKMKILLLCVCVCLHVCVCSVAQLCPTLWGPMDCNLPSSCAHRIFQARILGWSAISYSRDLPNLGSNRRLLWPLKEKHQIYHSIWLNNSFSCFLTSSYLCWWERTELQVYFEGHFTWRKLISTNYLWKFISCCWT